MARLDDLTRDLLSAEVRRGRPITGKALTPAQRVKRHRDKKRAELVFQGNTNSYPPKGSGSDSSDWRCVKVRLPDEFVTRLDALVEASGISRSHLVAELIKADFDRLEALAKTLTSRRVLDRSLVAVVCTTATKYPNGYEMA